MISLAIAASILITFTTICVVILILSSKQPNPIMPRVMEITIVNDIAKITVEYFDGKTMMFHTVTFNIGKG